MSLSFVFFFFFYSKCYVVFITQAYAQKSTRGTLGLLVPFEVGVRGGGYRTPRPPARNSGRTTSICSRLILLERETTGCFIDPSLSRHKFLTSSCVAQLLPCLAMCLRHRVDSTVRPFLRHSTPPSPPIPLP